MITTTENYTLFPYAELIDINIRSKAEQNYFHYRKNIYFEMGIEYTGLTRIQEWDKAKENVLFDMHGNFFIINGDADRVLTHVTY